MSATEDMLCDPALLDDTSLIYNGLVPALRCGDCAYVADVFCSSHARRAFVQMIALITVDLESRTSAGADLDGLLAERRAAWAVDTAMREVDDLE